MIKIIGNYTGKCRICYNIITDIKYKHISTSNEIRSIGVESCHEFKYVNNCNSCGTDINSEVIIFEYPTGFKNCIESGLGTLEVFPDKFEITNDLPISFNSDITNPNLTNNHCYIIINDVDGDIKLISTKDIQLNPLLIEGSVVIRVLSDNFEKSKAIFENSKL